MNKFVLLGLHETDGDLMAIAAVQRLHGTDFTTTMARAHEQRNWLGVLTIRARARVLLHTRECDGFNYGWQLRGWWRLGQVSLDYLSLGSSMSVCEWERGSVDVNRLQEQASTDSPSFVANRLDNCSCLMSEQFGMMWRVVLGRLGFWNTVHKANSTINTYGIPRRCTSNYSFTKANSLLACYVSSINPWHS